MEFDTPPEPRPPRSPLSKVGWSVAGFAFVLAFAANGVLAQGAGRFEEAASAVHRLALLIMLVGMITAMIGHRIDWFASRPGAASSPTNETISHPTTGAATFVRSTPHAATPHVASPWASVAQGGDDSVWAEVVEEPREAAAALNSSESERTATGRVDGGLSHESLVGIAFVFGLTFVFAATQVVVLLAPPLLGFLLAVPVIIALNALLLIIVCWRRGYLRAFAWGAWPPAFCLLFLLPRIFDLFFQPVFAYGSGVNDVNTSTKLMFVIGLMSVIPGGLLGLLVAAVLASLRSQDAGAGGRVATGSVDRS